MGMGVTSAKARQHIVGAHIGKAGQHDVCLGQNLRAADAHGLHTGVVGCLNTGHGVPNISCIKLQRGDEVLEDVAIGSGPLDASFKAINRMLGMDVKLESFSLNAVTDGEDAVGEAVVKVALPDGRACTGTGISTDIIESSIRAYVNGINKIMESGN